MNDEVKDQGHKNLIDDLAELTKLAAEYQFHDFQNSSFAVPKMKLVELLEEMIKRTKSGRYDNVTPHE